MSGNAMIVERVPCLRDNYVWVLHEPSQQLTAVVDPSESEPVISILNSKGYNLDYIFNTHHHWDHTGGNMELKAVYPQAKIIGPRADQARIPGIDQSYGEGDSFKFGPLDVKVFDTPGHTKGHITFWIPGADALFPGDTLFSLGCGRLFEGTPQQMWASLSKFVGLPDSTSVFCAHEYTQSNARFAVHIDPHNQTLAARKQEIDELRSQNLPTVPSNLGQEKAANPFLRPSDPAIRKHLGVDADAEDWVALKAIRAAKDNF